MLPATLAFTRMHGAGNVMQVIDLVSLDAATLAALDPRWPTIAVDVLARRRDMGGDQMVLVLPPPPPAQTGDTPCDITMRFFNADGSEGDLCGNGLRCFGKYVADRRLVAKTEALATGSDVELVVWTSRSGLVRVTVHAQGPAHAPAGASWVTVLLTAPIVVDSALQVPVRNAAGEPRTFIAAHVTMGNPNCVINVGGEDMSDELVRGYGPFIETHELFPHRTNVEFVRPTAPDQLEMRVWERGSGETLACGSGACAAVMAAVSLGASK